ncbi:hypothetical protein [Stenotrophomonas maltophilia]|uniref:hypothetical protein n=1 Tax=Stenotrophomonas maltophilia TaxID=40324 RepID=UPI0003456C33|nr:hypothetical protein [Stenotrophomonas maltophilia]KWV45083.1 hypothetical protein AS591_20470 [Stenotrophomonas maltophilia]MBA0459240.1 hypothetical protein [Stenotrophomonas maltophilia]MCF3455416.1 hypothetical protein [Stenotrophomonas maltophilia]MCF3540857.1 hypothetical protein [Stenotrophomonas maltophilia]
MIPTGGLSNTPQPAPFSERVNSTLQPLIDYEMGGRAINDTSAGLQYQLWRVRVDEDVVYLGPDGGNEQPAFIRPGITEVALAFDQNMQPVIAFTQGGQAWLWWFDGTVPGMVFTSILGAVNPRVTLDDKRRGQTSSSDVILAYLRAGSLYYRQQRDRYLTEYLLTANPPCGGLATLCMSTGGRLQFGFGGA